MSKQDATILKYGSNEDFVSEQDCVRICSPVFASNGFQKVKFFFASFNNIKDMGFMCELLVKSESQKLALLFVIQQFTFQIKFWGVVV